MFRIRTEYNADTDEIVFLALFEGDDGIETRSVGIESGQVTVGDHRELMAEQLRELADKVEAE